MHVFMGIPASVRTVYVDSEARGEETEETVPLGVETGGLSQCLYHFKVSLLMRTDREESF